MMPPIDRDLVERELREQLAAQGVDVWRIKWDEHFVWMRFERAMLGDQALRRLIDVSGLKTHKALCEWLLSGVHLRITEHEVHRSELYEWHLVAKKGEREDRHIAFRVNPCRRLGYFKHEEREHVPGQECESDLCMLCFRLRGHRGCA